MASPRSLLKRVRVSKQENPFSEKSIKASDLYNEFDHQCSLFEWAKSEETLRAFPSLKKMYSIPNGAKVPFRKYRLKSGKTISISPERTKLMKEGLKPGVPDVHLPVARGIYHSLYIEMKAKKNKAQDNQLEVHEEFREEGHYVAICYGFEAAKKLIIQYLCLRADYVLSQEFTYR